eukprot:1708882-Prymnesium_polylepis.1
MHEAVGSRAMRGPPFLQQNKFSPPVTFALIHNFGVGYRCVTHSRTHALNRVKGGTVCLRWAAWLAGLRAAARTAAAVSSCLMSVSVPDS